MSKTIRVFVLLAGLLMMAGLVFSQSTPQASSSSTTPSAQSSTPAAATAAPVEAAKPEPAQAEKASGLAKHEEEEEENAEFKYAGVVRKVASATGLPKETVYWIFLVINFLILASGIAWGVRKALPRGFAPRTEEIKRGLEEAARPAPKLRPA